MSEQDAQVETPLLSAQSRQRIDEWTAKFPEQHRRAAVLAALTIAQEQNGGWLCQSLIDDVADYLRIKPIHAYEVASFYSLFHLEPVGRHKVSICDNISCMLCGADAIIEHVQEKLGITLGETTPDGRITLVREEECLAACIGAPMLVVDGHYHEKLTIEKVDQLLDSLE
jgi:NADH-quinone oxidoreductase subunit E